MAYSKTKENPIECTRIIPNSIAAGEIKRAYLLYGEERYLVLQNKKQLLDYLVAPGDTMNLNLFQGNDFRVTELIDIGETLPFMAEHRVIMLEDSGLFSGSGEELATYLEEAPESTIFVFVESKVDARSKLFKTVQNLGLTCNYVKQTGATLGSWINQRAKKANLSITGSVVDYFLRRVGDDMNAIDRELEKLISYCYGESAITVDAINAICRVTLEDHIFDMIEAVSRRDKKRAFQLYRDLLALKESPVKILSLMTSEFERLMVMKSLRERGLSEQQIVSETGYKSFVVSKRMNVLNAYTLDQLKSSLKACVSADQSFKEGQITDVLALEVLLVELTE